MWLRLCIKPVIFCWLGSINTLARKITMPAPQSKNYCATINNWNQTHVEHLESMIDEDAQYIIAGKETAPSTGTAHLQCFIQFSKPKTLSYVVSRLPGAHVTKCNGNATQNITYCTKEDSNAFEFGKKPKTQGSGQKELWKNARQAAKDGRFEDIDDQIYSKYINNFKAIHAEAQVMPPPLEHPNHLWIYGETGTGKSHSVATTYPTRYIKNLNKWWDGYTDQEVVHIDEIDPNHKYLTSFLKQWADKWPFNAEIKGSSKMLRPPKLIVTSNYSIDEMDFPPNDLPAIKRRFTEIKKTRDQDIII